MKKDTIKLILLILVILMIALPTTARSKNIDVGISIKDDKIHAFYLAIGDYYRVPEREVIIIKKRYPVIYEDEIPLVMLISKYGRVSPETIIELRRANFSWYEIMIRYRVYPEAVFRDYICYGPPYGVAWGYHKKHKHKCKIKKLKDRDLVELANIKFLAEYYGESPEVIVKYREKTPSYIEINYYYYTNYKEKHDHDKKKKHKEKYEWEKKEED
ncbi:MAG: hypothetical protein ACPLSJ_02095 [Thermosulfidibacteraceae bacterium]